MKKNIDLIIARRIIIGLEQISLASLLWSSLLFAKFRRCAELLSLLQVEGSEAAQCGRILRGDQILKVDGTDLSQAQQQAVVAVIRAAAPGRIKMEFRRGVAE